MVRINIYINDISFDNFLAKKLKGEDFTHFSMVIILKNNFNLYNIKKVLFFKHLKFLESL